MILAGACLLTFAFGMVAGVGLMIWFAFRLDKEPPADERGE